MPADSRQRRLDVLGQQCPQPVFRARVRLDELGDGEVLTVLADDPLAELDLKVFCERAGHEFVDCRRESDHLVIRIRKTVRR